MKNFLRSINDVFKAVFATKKGRTGLLVVLIAAGILHIISPPAEFPAENHLLHIEEGKTVSETAENLHEEKIIRSPFVFIAFNKMFGGQVKAGGYFFQSPVNTFEIARRLAGGIYNTEPVKITVTEGATIQQIGSLLEKQLPEFSAERFIKLAQGKEGFLFPDTYFFSPTITEKEVLARMRDHFQEKITPLMPEIRSSDRSLEDIVIMASLLEHEARTTETRKIIAGILWKRLDDGMRLQVDAVFPYILGRNTFEVTKKDLRVDSPYNTYRYEGLPVGAIGNPSLDSISAALNPAESEYWFYLSDMNGNMHYAVTFEEHVENKRTYLR